jgi:hypothetical protein
VLDPEIVAVDPERHRPFQGWRYLESRDAPPDLSAHWRMDTRIPPEMADELRTLGRR